MLCEIAQPGPFVRTPASPTLPNVVFIRTTIVIQSVTAGGPGGPEDPGYAYRWRVGVTYRGWRSKVNQKEPSCRQGASTQDARLELVLRLIVGARNFSAAGQRV